jgi:hypothetical protein
MYITTAVSTDSGSVFFSVKNWANVFVFVLPYLASKAVIDEPTACIATNHYMLLFPIV